MTPTQKVKYAVEEIVKNINSRNMSPNSAAVKAAKDLELTPHFIKRASEVVNVALTYNHFKHNPKAKEAQFPLIDHPVVVREVYDVGNKPHIQKKSEWFPITITADDIPDFVKLENGPFIKTYRSLVKSASKELNENPLSRTGIYEKSAAYFDQMERKIDDLQTELSGLYKQSNDLIFSLVDQFNKDNSYRISFDEFEKQAYSRFQDRSMPYLDFIYKLSSQIDPRGDHLTSYKCYDDSKEIKIFSEFISTVDALKKVSTELSEIQSQYATDKENLRSAYSELIRKQSGEIPKEVIFKETAVEEIVGTKEDPIKIAAEKKMQEMDNELLTPLQQKTLPETLKKRIIDFKKEKQAKLGDIAKPLFGGLGKLFEPEKRLPSTSFLDNLDRKLVLEDLIVTDPILKEMDPHDVVHAYTQFLHYAPELSKEKEVVRAALRQILSGQAIDPLTAQQYIKANTDFVKQKALEQGMDKSI